MLIMGQGGCVWEGKEEGIGIAPILFAQFFCESRTALRKSTWKQTNKLGIVGPLGLIIRIGIEQKWKQGHQLQGYCNHLARNDAEGICASAKDRGCCIRDTFEARISKTCWCVGFGAKRKRIVNDDFQVLATELPSAEWGSLGQEINGSEDMSQI